MTTMRRAFYLPAWLLAAAIAAIYGTFSVSRHHNVYTAGYDLGIFDQAVRDYSKFRAPIVPIKGGDYNIFADHFHPIIALAAPLYWIWDTPVTLLVVQALLIGASVPVVHAFAARRTGRRPALVIALAYGLGWPLQAMFDADFHEIAYGVPILALGIDALDREDDRVLLGSCALLLLVREDMGVLVALLGVLRLLVRPRWRWPGWVLIGSGMIVFAVITLVVIPHFAPNGFAYWTYDALGKNVPDAIKHVIGHPVATVNAFFTPFVKTKTLAFLFVPLLLLPLRSRYAWLALPLLAERFFNSRHLLWTVMFHYNALPWVVLVMAMTDGAARLGLFRDRRTRTALLAYLLVPPLVLLVWPGGTPAPIRRMITGEQFKIGHHTKDARVVLARIPRDVCVSVDDRLAPQLTNRDRVSEPGLASPKTDFVILDRSQATVGYLQPAPGPVQALWLRRGYEVVYTRGDYVVLQSPTFAGPSAFCRP